ncbi:hypothetical protein DFH06DRAFT_1147141 [Mycena polygramma]|nr:hypothetical protein DFH06DRAFT_1147141 [Mycena polygramma]
MLGCGPVQAGVTDDKAERSSACLTAITTLRPLDSESPKSLAIRITLPPGSRLIVPLMVIAVQPPLVGSTRFLCFSFALGRGGRVAHWNDAAMAIELENPRLYPVAQHLWQFSPHSYLPYFLRTHHGGLRSPTVPAARLTARTSGSTPVYAPSSLPVGGYVGVGGTISQAIVDHFLLSDRMPTEDRRSTPSGGMADEPPSFSLRRHSRHRFLHDAVLVESKSAPPASVQHQQDIWSVPPTVRRTKDAGFRIKSSAQLVPLIDPQAGAPYNFVLPWYSRLIHVQ